jgi:hypothetical protein
MTATEAMDIGSRLIHLLSQQRLLYRQLYDLAQKQSGLVDGKDPEMLLRVLASRQRLITKLATIDQELKPIREDWQAIATSLPPKQREEVQQLVESVQEILGDILANDEKDSKALFEQKQMVANEIRTTSTGKKMNNAYTQPVVSEPSRYFDTTNG